MISIVFLAESSRMSWSFLITFIRAGVFDVMEPDSLAEVVEVGDLIQVSTEELLYRLFPWAK